MAWCRWLLCTGVGASPTFLFNHLYPKIKIWILIFSPIHFLETQWGEVEKISSKFILNELCFTCFKCQWCKHVSLWLCLFGCVLQGPIKLKVLCGTMLGTNEILASKHCIAAVKVKQSYFKPPFWFVTILSSFITAKGF